ncbi:hypothetical protein ACFVW9_39285 [Streptomyces sp. NPDC058217]
MSTSSLTAWGDSGGHAGVVWADGDTSKVSLYQGNQRRRHVGWPVG